MAQRGPPRLDQDSCFRGALQPTPDGSDEARSQRIEGERERGRERGIEGGRERESASARERERERERERVRESQRE